MLIDLSHAYANGMFASAALPPPHFELCRRNPNVTHASLPLHAGTHVDSPRHFFEDGLAIEDLALDRLCGDAVCWSVRKGAGQEITAADLAGEMRALPPARILVISTGWSALFGEHDRYAEHPYLSLDAADLIAGAGVQLLAMDVPTPDMPERLREPGFDWPVHRRLLGDGVLIAENLANLERVERTRFRFAALPIAVAGADGAPVRAVAAT